MVWVMEASSGKGGVGLTSRKTRTAGIISSSRCLMIRIWSWPVPHTLAAVRRKKRGGGGRGVSGERGGMRMHATGGRRGVSGEMGRHVHATSPPLAFERLAGRRYWLRKRWYSQVRRRGLPAETAAGRGDAGTSASSSVERSRRALLARASRSARRRSAAKMIVKRTKEMQNVAIKLAKRMAVNVTGSMMYTVRCSAESFDWMSGSVVSAASLKA